MTNNFKVGLRVGEKKYRRDIEYWKERALKAEKNLNCFKEVQVLSSRIIGEYDLFQRFSINITTVLADAVRKAFVDEGEVQEGIILPKEILKLSDFYEVHDKEMEEYQLTPALVREDGSDEDYWKNHKQQEIEFWYGFENPITEDMIIAIEDLKKS